MRLEITRKTLDHAAEMLAGADRKRCRAGDRGRRRGIDIRDVCPRYIADNAFVHWRNGLKHAGRARQVYTADAVQYACLFETSQMAIQFGNILVKNTHVSTPDDRGS